MPKRTTLNVVLLQYNVNAESIAAMAARLCYSDSDIIGLFEKVSQSEQREFIEKLVNMGHNSVFEHISFTFGVEGISRTLTHQLVRHRVASYSQQSQRYVKVKGELPYILPPTIEENPKALKLFEDNLSKIEKCYEQLLETGVPAEDARYILPNATETKIVITMNARELLHFFALRSCERAQWEIRDLSNIMLSLAYNVAPSVFKKAGPGCVNKGCTEGKFTCGKAKEVKEQIEYLKKKSSTGNLH